MKVLTCSKYDTARTFCIDEIGVTIPPKLHPNASPNNNDLENLDSVGRSLTIGKIIVAQRIGAVWLLINILKNNPRNIIARINNFGFVPKASCN